jgi:hypothetical protein
MFDRAGSPLAPRVGAALVRPIIYRDCDGVTCERD